MITLSHYLVLAAILFAIAIVGIFLNRKNVIVLLMAIELMLLAVNMNFVAFSHFHDDTAGQIFVFFILTVAAAESAIGLAILVVLFRNINTIHVERRKGRGERSHDTGTMRVLFASLLSPVSCPRS
jgi:NADH-quinone oxidoreductase subunit K